VVLTHPTMMQSLLREVYANFIKTDGPIKRTASSSPGNRAEGE
jgi:hypothetical protein